MNPILPPMGRAHAVAHRRNVCGLVAALGLATCLISPQHAGAAVPLWGVCGHPTWTDYNSSNATFRAEQVSLLRDLGSDLYRCSFEFPTGSYRQLLDIIVPAAQAQGIQVLPILPITSLGLGNSTVYGDVYQRNFEIATLWANYAISHGYHLPYWELGNEMENWNLVTVSGDGSSPSQYTDAKPNGFERLRAALNGGYDGLRDAYAKARAAGNSTIAPQILSPGTAYRHWGLLKRVKDANGATPVPWDILSWHWCTPRFGSFTAVITDPSSSAYNKTPVQCLNEFKKKSDPTQPMDIWITECGRSQIIPGSGLAVCGSATSRVNPAANQDWALQAQELDAEVRNLASVNSVKAILVYELLDETKAYADATQGAQAEMAYYGLVTGLGVPNNKKTAFWTFQSLIAEFDASEASKELISFHWGSGTQVGPAVLGKAGDLWGSSMSVTQAVPQQLTNVYGEPTTVKASWLATGLQDQQVDSFWTKYDPATKQLMVSYLSSYHYSPSNGAIVLTLSGLVPGEVYDLVVYGAGVFKADAPLLVTGGTALAGGTTGASRLISAGPGVAYARFKVASSPSGTIEVRTTKTAGNVYINGFQLAPQAPAINYHWGSLNQSGPAVVGRARDFWGGSLSSNQTVPLLLSDANENPTGVTLTWRSSSLADNKTEKTWTSYDDETRALMVSYLSSYQYPSGSGAITFTLGGLRPLSPYTLVVYGAGLYVRPTPLQVTGNSTLTATNSGATRRISSGPGVAYSVFNTTTSPTGTLEVTTARSGGDVYLNGFQLIDDSPLP